EMGGNLMRTFRTLHPVAAASLLAWALSGCDSAQSTTADPAQQLATARLTLVDDAHATGSVKVAVKLADSGKLIDETLIKLDGKSALDLPLPAAKYLLDVTAFADDKGTTLLC